MGTLLPPRMKPSQPKLHPFSNFRGMDMCQFQSLLRQALPKSHLLKLGPRRELTLPASQVRSTWYRGNEEDLLRYHELSNRTSARKSSILPAQATKLWLHKRWMGEMTKNRLRDQGVSAVAAALMGYHAPARIVLPVVNLNATVKQSKLYHATRKSANSQLAQINVSVLAFKANRLCSTKTPCPERG